MKDSEIHHVHRLVKKAIVQWREPVVGIIAQESRDPFRILIACVLSLRTKDRTTAEAAERLFKRADNPTSVLKIPRRQLENTIYPVGFYRNKAKQIHQICQSILQNFAGKVPGTIEELLTLNGVGRKTANLVVTVGYNKPGICVDIHVYRICNRWGYVKTTRPDQTEEMLRNKLPRRYWITFNDLLVPFGQNLCRPISPYCSQCPVARYCAKVGVQTSR